MRRLLRFWFTFEEAVTPRQYLRHGLALALVKYAVDAALIWFAASLLWTPLDYIYAGADLERSRLAAAPTWLSQVLALWTVPFLWIGLTMSIRRALDAGLSAWSALLFSVPIVNYVYMAVLCAVPSTATPREVGTVASGREAKQSSELVAAGVGMAIGLTLAALAVLTGSYGATLFLGGPFMIGAVAAYVFNRRYDATPGETRGVTVLTITLVGIGVLLFALEGLICIIMAWPLATGIALLGGIAGRYIARSGGRPAGAYLAVLMLPVGMSLGDGKVSPKLREVRSSIEIDAPPEAVWRNVVSFPRLDERPGWLFRAGVAYPIEARIDGEGVGAVRYCEFSTGPFVEPITHWEPGVRLSFDVTQQPPPMRELSPYGIDPPHLDGYFQSRRGEFRLIALAGGRTRLEGSTWYQLQVGPAPYWTLFANAIVSRIHQRVLRQVKVVSERGA